MADAPAPLRAEPLASVAALSLDCTPMPIPVAAWEGCYDDRWADLIVPEAFKHPAKFSPALIQRIYAHGLAQGWWRVGDLIGDPFGGIAGGGIMAGYAGLNWIGVELEPQFVELGNQNLAMHGPRWMVLDKATRVTLVQGDSRRFAEIVGQATGVVTSPPYNLPMSQDHNGSRGGSRGTSPSETGAFVKYGRTPGQIEGMENGTIDAVLTSPPYAETLNHGGGPDTHEDKRRGRSLLGIKEGYGGTAGQIGKLRNGDLAAVVTSPPWEKSLDCGTVTKAERIAFARANGISNAEHVSPIDIEHARQDDYGATAGQVGQLAGETYWQAMHAVYGQCRQAMRPGGYMAVVVKDYVKDKARVPLCDQTLTLLESLGFAPVLRVHAMLVKERRHVGLFGEHVERTDRKSFFRRLAEKKGSPRIDEEQVLVVRRA